MNEKKPKKIAVISHALVQDIVRERWRKLAGRGDYEVHLIVPNRWRQYWFGNEKPYEREAIQEENFYVHPFPVTDEVRWHRYFFKSLDIGLRTIKPDLIYIIHEEGIWVHLQVYLYRKLWAPQAKIIFFSMNAMGVETPRWYHKWRWKQVCKNTEAALVHYPGCVRSLREGGYKKPIYMQTQVGVNDTFYPDKDKRYDIRKKIGFSGKFVVGFTGRIIADKGVDTLIDSFPGDNKDWALLLVGDGNLSDGIKKRATREGWAERLHITGEINQKDVPDYMNAMDCFVLGSKTTGHWIDTFPLVTVQAQACGIPVIASDSASLPWQLGDTALFFKEGNAEELRNRLFQMAENEDLRKDLAVKGRARCRSYFTTDILTENFVRIAEQILNDRIEYADDTDEEYTQWKAVP